MKKRTKWCSYSKLAWTELILASPEEYSEETEQYISIIKEHSKIEVRTLLHLGCGAGGNDYTFKKHYKVTGVDISENMLEIARCLNPEVVYYHGDMRTIELGECFDAAHNSIAANPSTGDNLTISSSSCSIALSPYSPQTNICEIWYSNATSHF
jgi:SAM-dependent methyltransferase